MVSFIVMVVGQVGGRSKRVVYAFLHAIRLRCYVNKMCREAVQIIGED
jgi:hypothetical protein